MPTEAQDGTDFSGCVIPITAYRVRSSYPDPSNLRRSHVRQYFHA